MAGIFPDRAGQVVLLFSGAVLLSSCGSSSAVSGDPGSSGASSSSGGPVTIDRSCDLAAFPSPQWTQCELQNYAMVTQAPAEEAANPAFLQRWQTQGATNFQAWLARAAADPSWLSPMSGNTPQTPLCTTWGEQCSGDPFRYPEATGPDGDQFYRDQAEVTPVVFYDDGCARISGRVWAPKGSTGARLPNVVIENGSIQAPETLYWWAAQELVRAGYVVMTFDPRGQGRSDLQTPTGVQGSNFNSSVFWTGLVNAIDFFRSTPERPYPHNQTCAGTYPTKVTAYNPYYQRLDADRLGIAGHSLGAIGVSVVQGYGGNGADPWPGKLDSGNPVKVTVAWDGLSGPDGGSDGGAGGNLPLPNPASSAPKFAARTPALNLASEYGLTPTPFLQPPDPAKHENAFAQWIKAGQPVISITIRGSTHYEFSLLPTFPATSWCPDPSSGACSGGWGNALSQHYTLAWFDRWLKQPDESGYADADARLLDDNGVQGRNKMSFRYRSGRSFPDRSGVPHRCDDIRAGC